ncbi:hypothetical protein Taro_017390 [Colocasia esculenta]|uniref:Uncharacterized protein n=1 Tax=Colocasia esculenta TaxID=4460 RepID=A0A843UZ92_COLES|nr:hypothetical protein [Colocasia esculenta]
MELKPGLSALVTGGASGIAYGELAKTHAAVTMLTCLGQPVHIALTRGQSFRGKALSLALGKKGIFVTIVDLSEEKGKEVAHLVEKDSKDFHPDRKFPSSMFIQCDVTNSRVMKDRNNSSLVWENRLCFSTKEMD